MSDQTYRGSTNYETWIVKLWLDREGYFKTNPNPSASEIRDYVEATKPDTGASMFSDLLISAIGSVNWYEIEKAQDEDED